MGVSGQAADRLPEVDPEATAELLDVVGDLPAWRLVPARWERVGQILDDVIAALASADLGALREATAQLELASPVRVYRIGATELISMPEPVRDRHNNLVHALRTGESSLDPDAIRQPDPERGDPQSAR